MAKLKAVKPEEKKKRLKLFLYGPTSIGKSIAASQFPNAYIIDTESGTDFYNESISKSGSVVFQSNNFDDIKEEIKTLLTTKHNFKTLIIDPVTHVYNSVQDKWNAVFEAHAKTQKEKDVQDFGMRYWNKVKGDFKSFQRLFLALDMNVIVTAHQKDVYGTGFNKIGVSFDSMKGDDYLFDLVFRLENRSNKQDGPRIAVKVKERAEIGKAKFPEEFEWSYDNFKKFYGAEIIEKASSPVDLATPEQLKRVAELTEAFNVPDEEIGKWLSKLGVEKFEDAPSESVAKWIKYYEGKVGK